MSADDKRPSAPPPTPAWISDPETRAGATVDAATADPGPAKGPGLKALAAQANMAARADPDGPSTEGDHARPADAPTPSTDDPADGARAPSDDSDWVFIPMAPGRIADAATPADAQDEPAADILTPARAIARGALDAALTADLRARLAAEAPLAIVVSVPGPDWVDDIRMAFTDLTTGDEVAALAGDGSPTGGQP